MKTITAIIYLILIRTIAQAKPWKDEAFTITTWSDINVDIGTYIFDIELMYPNPCVTIFSQNTTTTTDTIRTTAEREIYHLCDATHNNTFITEMSKLINCSESLTTNSTPLEHIRNKRDLGLSLVIAVIIILAASEGVKYLDEDSDHNKLKRIIERDNIREL